MIDWGVTTVGHLSRNFDTARRPIKSSERAEGKTPYYGASGVVDYVDGHTHDGDYLLVSEDGENLRSRTTPIAFMASGTFWANNHVHVIQCASCEQTRFLQYLLSVTDLSGYLTGSAQPKLSQSALNSIEVRVPDERTQRGIAEVLGALDDKIAANRAVTEAADELARALASSVAERCALADLADARRQTVKPEAFGFEPVTHLSLPGFDDGQRLSPEDPSMIKSAKFAVREPSVLVSKLNPRFPRVWDIVDVPEGITLASTEFVVLEPREVSTSVLAAGLASPAFSYSLQSKVAGTSGSHQRVKPADMLAALVSDVRSLSDEVKSLLTGLGRRTWLAREESNRLAATRDALLPLLMSGRVRVKDVEDTVGELV